MAEPSRSTCSSISINAMREIAGGTTPMIDDMFALLKMRCGGVAAIDDPAIIR